MKECPVCKTSYTDDSLKYCLSDGSALVDAIDGEQTFVRRGEPPIRVTIPQPVEQTAVLLRQQQPTVRPSGAGTLLKVAVILLGFGFLLTAVLGIAGLLYYNSTRTVVVTNTPLDQPNRP